MFEKNSDIRIKDGQAAISFRSYYTGKAIIEATSPGLKSARIEIYFVGGPVHKPKMMPTVKERPYICFVSGSNEAKVQTFGCNNPVFASSQRDKNSAKFAADGDSDTYWQAATVDSFPWWKLDTEKCLNLTGISVSFPKTDVYCYIIEVSNDD